VGSSSTEAKGLQFWVPWSKKRPKRRRRKPVAELEATYICDSCGEEIVVPVDISGGSHQDYVEDCPVCCHPMTLHVDIDPDGEARIEGEHE
jgi:transcription elongation factor Elf1